MSGRGKPHAGGGRHKKHEHEEHVNHERWLVSYADFITLLFVLFVVMFALSNADVKRFAKLQGSLQKAFKIEVLTGNDPTALNGQDGFAAMQSIVNDAIVESAFATSNSAMVTTMEELKQTLDQLPRPPAGATVEVARTKEGFVISMAGNLFFDSGRADLKPEALTFMDTLVERLGPLPNDLRIEGHTDNIAIDTPLYPSNWELSSARATTVARYFAHVGGISPRRLSAAGYGEFRPVAPNDTREGRARNRRVDIVVLAIAPDEPATQRSGVAAGGAGPSTTGGGRAAPPGPSTDPHAAPASSPSNLPSGADPLPPGHEAALPASRPTNDVRFPVIDPAHPPDGTPPPASSQDPGPAPASPATNDHEHPTAPQPATTTEHREPEDPPAQPSGH